jgi:RimJ/RimL family protein N-acetyltransferase
VTAAPQLHGDGVVLVPAAADHVPELRRIIRTPEVRRRWGDEEAESADWPLRDPWSTPFAILIGGAVRGFIQYGEEDAEMYRSASVDIFLEATVHGRGHGRAAIVALAEHLIDDRGHHRLTIDPAADNQAAIRCYAAVGFRPVGIMREYERDVDGPGWHDGLLMDLLAGELRREPVTGTR